MTNFKFSELTILTGPNNSGKSSLAKALFLLQDNAKKNNLELLDFSGESHALGTFSYAYNRNANEKQGIDFSFMMSHVFYLSSNINFIFLPSVQMDFCYTKNGEQGKLTAFKFVKLDNKTRVPKIVFWIQPLPVSKAESNFISIINLDFLIRNFKEEIERVLSVPYEKTKMDLQLDEIDTTKVVSFTFPRLTSNNKSIPNDVLEFINEDVINIALMNKIFKGEEKKRINGFCNMLKKFIISELSFINYTKDKWQNSNVADLAAIEGIWGEYENVSYLSILERYFYEKRTFKINVNELDFKRPVYDYDKSDMLGGKMVKINVDCDKYEDLLVKVGEYKVEDILSKSFIAFFKFFENELKQLLSNFSEAFRFEHLEAVRANTQRLYSNKSQGTNFNDLLLRFSRAELRGEEIDFINRWLKKFDLGDSLKIERISGVATKVLICNNDRMTELADFGYGVSQLLPIILKIALDFQPISEKEKDSSLKSRIATNYLIIEEPETNLHPKFQSMLADLFLDAMKTFKIRLIIETHSEYLIRKLQYLIATKELLPDEATIYYFNDPEDIPKGEELIRKIDFNEEGTLSSDFGPGFFDEADNIAIKRFNFNQSSKN